MADRKLSLARKYRPQNISEYIGNDILLKKLNVLIDKEILPQTIMLYGERGTGKTSLSKLIAKSLLCENVTDGNACDECDTCRQVTKKFITEGETLRNLPIYEYNISQLNTREDAENIVTQIKGRTVGNTKRIYILDEIQRATKEAQSTFLKIAEEPPKDVYIILCTTNPENLLKPFKSRFYQFKINRPTTKDVVKKLEKICRSEGFDYSKDGLKVLAYKKHNIMREILNTMEVIGNVGGITRATVEEELNVLSQDIYIDFLKACRKGNLGLLMVRLNALQENSAFTIKEFAIGMGNFFYDLISLRSGVKLDMYSEEELRKLKEFIKTFNDREILEILETIKDYSQIDESEDFHILSLGVIILDILKVEEQSKEVTENDARRSYTEVQEKLREIKPKTVVKDKEVTENDIFSMFENASKVDID